MTRFGASGGKSGYVWDLEARLEDPGNKGAVPGNELAALRNEGAVSEPRF